MLKLLILFIGFIQVKWIVSTTPVNLNLLMPNVSPKVKDSYLCKKFELDADKPLYITEFEPKSSKEIAHHILLFGCDEVGSEDVWNCGEMARTESGENQYKNGPVCRGIKQSIIFAWAMDAPKLVLPKDVAFKLGAGTDRKYLVMQVHYANVDKFVQGGTDNSGLVLKGQYEPLPKTAGVYLLETGGYIKPHSKENFESACEMTEDIEIFPFAYRTHAHKLGLVNSGYVIKSNEYSGKQEWVEIGRRSPQLPQMFFPATNKVSVKKGDILAARCTMNNFKDRNVYIGATGDDEMCNFYVMYYVNGEKLLSNNICLTYGPPYWHFDNFASRLGHKIDTSEIPRDISQVPANQQKELSDMGDHNNMHGSAHQEQHNSHQASDKTKLDALNQAYLLNQLLNEEQNSASDEYESDLDQLEKDYLIAKMLKKLNTK